MAKKNKQLSHRSDGQALLLALTILSIMLVIGTAVFSYSNQSIRTTRRSLKTTQCLSLAEAGIDHGIRQLNLDMDYTGTSAPIALGAGEFETIITGSGMQRELTSIAYIPHKTNYEIKKELRVDLNINNTNISFTYGVQAGEGGITMENNSRIIGDIYSNGSIDGSSGNSITGNAKIANNNDVIPPIEWTDYDGDFSFGGTNTVVDIAQSFEATENAKVTKVAMYLKKVGNPLSDITFYILGNSTLPDRPNKSNILGSKTISVSGITSTYSWAEAAITNSLDLTAGSKYWLVIDAGYDASNYWKIGVDNNNSYMSTNQTGLTSPNWNKNPNPTWNTTLKDFNFKIWLGKSSNYINRVNVTGDVYSHIFTSGNIGRDYFGNTFQNGNIGRHAHAYELGNCNVGGNAYATIDNCTVAGTKFTGSGEPDLPLSDYPITAANIQEFKNNASNNNNPANIHSGDYTPVGSGTINLGPIRVDGNLDLSNYTTLNITGTIYATGNIIFPNGMTVQLDSSYGVSSGMIITDQPTTISNNVVFHGSGQPNTYVLFMSTSNSLLPSNPAVFLKNNSDSAIIFAPYGLVNINNSTDVKETTAYKINLSQTATVTYEVGLQNILFSSGPAGGWRMKPGSWREINS